MIRIAVISVAHIHAKDFCDSICKLSGAGAPYVIWDDNQQRGRTYAERFGSRFEPDLDKVLADPAVDAFSICAENKSHMALLRRVLPLGKPTITDKPTVTTSAEADEVAALLAKYKTPLTCGFFNPFHAENRGVAALMASGELGTVTHCVFRNGHNAAYGRWFDSPDLAWFVDPELSCGGALFDMGSHGVHLLRHLCGPVREVWAMTANVAGTYPKVDDWGVIQMRFDNGVLGRVEGSWVSTGGPRGLELIGSKRTLFTTREGALMYAGPNEEARPVPRGDARPDRIARLVAIVRGELSREEIDEDIAASLDEVRIMDAAYRSAANGGWVPVAG